MTAADDPSSAPVEPTPSAADAQVEDPADASGDRTAHGAHDHGSHEHDGDDHPSDDGHHPNLPMEASLAPTCVEPGQTVTLEVVTEPYAMVIYQAVYSDGGGGGAPPNGSGYGGNAGGPTGPEGRYQSSWAVAPHAPTGPAKVQVIAAHTGSRQGQAELAFVVVGDAASEC